MAAVSRTGHPSRAQGTCRLGRGREHLTPVPTWGSVGHGDSGDHAASALECRVEGEIITATAFDRKGGASHSTAEPNRIHKASRDGGSGFSNGRRAQFP